MRLETQIANLEPQWPKEAAMHEIVTFNPDVVAVTTSLAIAEGTDTQHKNVLDLVRTHQQDLEDFGGVAFETRPFETAGGTQIREVAILNQEQATLLLTHMRSIGVVKAFKKALVKAFWELARIARQATLNPANLTRLQILAMAMEAEQKVQELSTQLEEIAPKAKALDRIATFSEGTFCIRDSAKMLQMREKELRLYLHDKHWIYPQNGEWRGYSEPLSKGLVEHKYTEGDKADGTGKWSSTQVRITAKGLTKLALLFGVSITAA